MGDWLHGLSLQKKYYEAKRDNLYVAKPRIYDSELSRAYAKNPISVLKKHVDTMKRNIFEKDIRIVKGIISGDKNAPANLNKDRMAEMIVNAALDAKVDPVIIAHIASKESNFNQLADNGIGKGIMQLTPITIEDMYQRPKIYEQSLLPILKKYKTPERLFAAAKKDPELNIKLGAYVFKAKLNKAHGNVKEALELYNGSKLNKYKYARTVMNNINQTRRVMEFKA